MSSAESVGFFRRAWNRLGTTHDQVEAAELRASARSTGATAIDECECGEVVTVSGKLQSVTLNPVAGLPSVDAELYDGTGRVLLTWMGRRRIVGIEPGRVLKATGRLVVRDGERVMFNPRYAFRVSEASE
ncbi:MAG: OB-fold nucleic acid binding domain-containing protein [Actinomycetes bacterium]